jgi:nitrogen fixation protein NifB
MTAEYTFKRPDPKIAAVHPCFSGGANMTKGRIHLPVSPACNIQCRFCRRAFNKAEHLPGVTAGLLKPEEAAALVRRALELCPDITVAGIAGPGDTLATPHALKTFEYIHREFPDLINCMSTNGLLLERYAEDVRRAGVKTLTVTVNAVDPLILEAICSHIILDGKKYEGAEGAEILIEAQKRGIRAAAGLGIFIKINIVLIPDVNSDHIAEIARTAGELGAGIINIIPLIPRHEFAGMTPPGCDELAAARQAAEAYLPVFRHCRHCRADAAGILGRGDLAELLYAGAAAEYRGLEQTFSHG